MNFTYDHEPTIRETVLQAMGFASVCWTRIENAGTFDAGLASEAGRETIEAISAIVTFELSRMLDPTNTAKEWNDAIEAAMARMEVLA